MDKEIFREFRGIPRSRRASAAEMALRLYSKERNARVLLAELKRRPTRRRAYRPPESVLLRARVWEYEGMRMYSLNARGQGGVRVIYLHGGAYVQEFTWFHWHFMEKLAAALDAEVIAPDYPLAPEGNWREAYERLLGLYGRVASEYPCDRLVLMGDSAGGGLALGLAEALTAGGEKGPDRLILLSPWVDAAMEEADEAEYEASDPMLQREALRQCARAWAAGEDIDHWRISPLRGDLSRLGRVLTLVGTRELFYPDVCRLQKALEAAGRPSRLVVGEGLNHVYPIYPIPEAAQALAEIVKEIQTPNHREDSI